MTTPSLFPAFASYDDGDTPESPSFSLGFDQALQNASHMSNWLDAVDGNSVSNSVSVPTAQVPQLKPSVTEPQLLVPSQPVLHPTSDLLPLSPSPQYPSVASSQPHSLASTQPQTPPTNNFIISNFQTQEAPQHLLQLSSDSEPPPYSHFSITTETRSHSSGSSSLLHSSSSTPGGGSPYGSLFPSSQTTSVSSFDTTPKPQQDNATSPDPYRLSGSSPMSPYQPLMDLQPQFQRPFTTTTTATVPQVQPSPQQPAISEIQISQVVPQSPLTPQATQSRPQIDITQFQPQSTSVQSPKLLNQTAQTKIQISTTTTQPTTKPELHATASKAPEVIPQIQLPGSSSQSPTQPRSGPSSLAKDTHEVMLEMVQTMKDMAARIGSLESEVKNLKTRLSKYEQQPQTFPSSHLLGSHSPLVSGSTSVSPLSTSSVSMGSPSTMSKSSILHDLSQPALNPTVAFPPAAQTLQLPTMQQPLMPMVPTTTTTPTRVPHLMGMQQPGNFMPSNMLYPGAASAGAQPPRYF